MSLRVVSLEKTCDACPAQWEGKLDDGRHVYIRYRYGNLSAGVGATSGEAVKASMDWGDKAHLLDIDDVGDALSGCMDIDQLEAETAGVLDFSAVTGVHS